jgi:hypothetical protein
MCPSTKMESLSDILAAHSLSDAKNITEKIKEWGAEYPYVFVGRHLPEVLTIQYWIDDISNDGNEVQQHNFYKLDEDKFIYTKSLDYSEQAEFIDKKFVMANYNKAKLDGETSLLFKEPSDKMFTYQKIHDICSASGVSAWIKKIVKSVKIFEAAEIFQNFEVMLKEQLLVQTDTIDAEFEEKLEKIFAAFFEAD